jgi:hypothetical protein
LADGFPDAPARQVVAEIHVVVVEQIEELEADLDVQPSGQTRVLEGRKIGARIDSARSSIVHRVKRCYERH